MTCHHHQKVLTVGPVVGFFVGLSVSSCVLGFTNTDMEVGHVMAFTKKTLLGARLSASLISTNPDLRRRCNRAILGALEV